MSEKSATVVEPRVESQEWFQGMVEECKATVVESVFRSRWALIEGWHAVGKRVIEERENIAKTSIGEEGVVSRLSHATGIGKRSIWRAIQFATRFPDLDAVPGGKNLSWSKVCNELLPDHREKAAAKPPEGEFDVVYADPDWGGTPDSEGAYSARRLSELRIPAAKDAILFLWAPPSRIADAIDVLRGWGFTYQTHVAWLMASERPNGRYAREIHECLLVATRGNIGVPDARHRPHSFYATDGVLKGEIRKYLDKMYPRGNKLGVFADSRRDWTTWSVDDEKGKAAAAGDEKGGI